ncbi:MAG: regulatory protein ArsR [Ilumatobacteraceae bacterium]|nr:regulatory protein ArsR [Ilumatobacteraceae bacterium]
MGGPVTDEDGIAEGAERSTRWVSKHLAVLREAGFVAVSVDGPRRWYSVRAEPFVEVDNWLTPYRWMWEATLDRLGDHLDTMPDDDPQDRDPTHPRGAHDVH